MARFLASFVLVSILFTGYSCVGVQSSTIAAMAVAGRNYARSGGYPRDSDAMVQPPETTKAPPSEKSSRGLGISAWGIIALIVTVSMVLIAIYYFMLFYPILCRKESKYNVMDTESSA